MSHKKSYKNKDGFIHLIRGVATIATIGAIPQISKKYLRFFYWFGKVYLISDKQL